jgi:hypothetical protein
MKQKTWGTKRPKVRERKKVWEKRGVRDVRMKEEEGGETKVINTYFS